MDYLTYFKRLEFLLEKIKLEQLDSPRQLEQQFGCSERTVRNMINVLREMGHDIHYSKQCKRYVLRKDD